MFYSHYIYKKNYTYGPKIFFMKKTIIALSKSLALFCFLALMAFTTNRDVPRLSIEKEEAAPCSCGGGSRNLGWDEYWWLGTTPMAFQIPHHGFSVSGSTVNIASLVVCANHSPVWTSSNYIGKILNTAYHPAALRTITMTSTIGSTWQVIIDPNGDFYIRHLTGTLPGTGVHLMSGSYSL